PSPPSISQTIDHTLLRPSATLSEISAICTEAITHNFRSVCTNPLYTPLVSSALTGTPVLVCTVTGFPLGATSAASKAFETSTAVSQGAQEIDTVLAVGLLKSGDYASVFLDLCGVVEAAQGRDVKVIIETGLLTDEEKVYACLIAAEAGAKWVKTCTGFSGGKATVEDVGLMKRAVEGYAGVKVKASGGVRTLEEWRGVVEAGAERVGTSSGLGIVK
ncbi:deoxyribose-phosphate aldolase, partial [Trichophaea hybrida]